MVLELQRKKQINLIHKKWQCSHFCFRGAVRDDCPFAIVGKCERVVFYTNFISAQKVAGYEERYGY